jgi:hypothetical protein
MLVVIAAAVAAAVVVVVVVVFGNYGCLLCTILAAPCYSLTTLFPNILSLCSSCSVRN